MVFAIEIVGFIEITIAPNIGNVLWATCLKNSRRDCVLLISIIDSIFAGKKYI